MLPLRLLIAKTSHLVLVKTSSVVYVLVFIPRER